MLTLVLWAALTPSLPLVIMLPFLSLGSLAQPSLLAGGFKVGVTGAFLFHLLLGSLTGGTLSISGGGRQEALLLTGLKPVSALLGNFAAYGALAGLVVMAMSPVGLMVSASGSMTLGGVAGLCHLVLCWSLLAFGLSQMLGTGAASPATAPFFGGALTLALAVGWALLDVGAATGNAHFLSPLGAAACGPVAQAGVWLGQEGACPALAGFSPPQGFWATVKTLVIFSLGPVTLALLVFAASYDRLRRSLTEKRRLAQAVPKRRGWLPWLPPPPVKPFPDHGNLVLALGQRVRTVLSRGAVLALCGGLVAGWVGMALVMPTGGPLGALARGLAWPLALAYLFSLLFLSAILVSLAFAEDARQNHLSLLRTTLVESQEAVDGKSAALVRRLLLTHLAVSAVLLPSLGLAHGLAFAAVGWGYLWMGVSLGMSSARPDEPLYLALFRCALSAGLYWVAGLSMEAPLNLIIQLGGQSQWPQVQGVVLLLKLLSRFSLTNALGAVGPINPLGAAQAPGPTALDALAHGVMVYALGRYLNQGVRRKFAHFWQTGEWPKGVAFTSAAGERGWAFLGEQQVAVPIGRGGDLVDPKRGVVLREFNAVLNPHPHQAALPGYTSGGRKREKENG